MNVSLYTVKSCKYDKWEQKVGKQNHDHAYSIEAQREINPEKADPI